jgi:hypothetical protein
MQKGHALAVSPCCKASRSQHRQQVLEPRTFDRLHQPETRSRKGAADDADGRRTWLKSIEATKVGVVTMEAAGTRRDQVRFTSDCFRIGASAKTAAPLPDSQEKGVDGASPRLAVRRPWASRPQMHRASLPSQITWKDGPQHSTLID